MQLRRSIFGALLCGLGACSNGGSGQSMGVGDVAPDQVTDIPAGTATSNQFGGTFMFETVGTACSGDCAGMTAEGEVRSACDIGAREEDSGQMMQAAGALSMDTESGGQVIRLEGGIDADGTFDVGGLVTYEAGAYTITLRLRGTVDADGVTSRGQALIRGNGSLGALDCYSESDITATRE